MIASEQGKRVCPFCILLRLPSNFSFQFFPRCLPLPLPLTFIVMMRAAIDPTTLHFGVSTSIPAYFSLCHVFTLFYSQSLYAPYLPFPPPRYADSQGISTVIPAYCDCAATLSPNPLRTLGPTQWPSGIPPLNDSRVYGLMRLLGTFSLFLPIIFPCNSITSFLCPGFLFGVLPSLLGARPPFYAFALCVPSRRACAAVALRGSTTPGWASCWLCLRWYRFFASPSQELLSGTWVSTVSHVSLLRNDFA